MLDIGRSLVHDIWGNDRQKHREQILSHTNTQWYYNFQKHNGRNSSMGFQELWPNPKFPHSSLMMLM